MTRRQMRAQTRKMALRAGRRRRGAGRSRAKAVHRMAKKTPVTSDSNAMRT